LRQPATTPPDKQDMLTTHPKLITIAITSGLLFQAYVCAADALADTVDAQSPTTAPQQIALTTVPNSDLARLRDAAQSNYQARQFATAANFYTRVCQTPGADANDFYWLGETYYHVHQYPSAAESFRQSIRRNPAGDNVRVRLVNALMAASQNDKGIQACTEALTVARDDYARRQLAVLMKVMTTPAPPAFKDMRHSPKIARMEH
jgi:TolA-binding protein